MVSTKIVAPVLSPIVRGVLSAAQPHRLFAAGEPGAWYDPNDLSTLFQDSAGTTPVTAAGQPVGLMLDKSGRGNHAQQSNNTKRPVLEMDTNGRFYLKGDSVSGRAMVTNTITPGTDKVQVFIGVRMLSGSSTSVLTELSSSSLSNNGSFIVTAPDTSTNYGFGSKGTTRVFVTSAFFLTPIPNVVTGLGDIAGDVVVLRANGKQVSRNTADQGAGNYLAYPLYLFGRGGTSLYFNGRLYGLIVRFGPNLNAATITDIERYMAGKTGIMF